MGTDLKKMSLEGVREMQDVNASEKHLGYWRWNRKSKHPIAGRTSSTVTSQEWMGGGSDSAVTTG